MAKANSKAAPKTPVTAIAGFDADAVDKLFGMIASIAYAIKTLAAQAHEDETGACLDGIKALAEKAGYLADAGESIINGWPKIGGVCGDYNGWLNVEDLIKFAAAPVKGVQHE